MGPVRTAAVAVVFLMAFSLGAPGWSYADDWSTPGAVMDTISSPLSNGPANQAQGQGQQQPPTPTDSTAAGAGDPAGSQPVVAPVSASQPEASAPVVKRELKSMPDAIAYAAQVIGAQHVKFVPVNFALQQYNGDFWSVPGDGYATVKSGVKPSDAILDITSNSGKYALECATAMRFVLYYAIVNHIGPDAFNNAIATTYGGTLKIGPGTYDGMLLDVMQHWSQGGSDENSFPGVGSLDIVTKLQPGAAIYMMNFKPTSDARAAGWLGENMLYIGNGKFFAHGDPNAADGIATADGVQSQIKVFWDPSPGPATHPYIPAGSSVQNQEPWLLGEYYYPSTGAVDKLGKPAN